MSFGIFLQDGDQGDDDQDEDAPRVADMEGRVEKYIGVKVKACSPFRKICGVNVQNNVAGSIWHGNFL